MIIMRNIRAVAMASVLINTKVPQKVYFYLIDDEIKQFNKGKITKTIHRLGGNIEFVKIKNSRLEDCYVSGELSRASYFRLDIANILDESVEKIIYLDCDLLVYDDIAKMWQFDMQGKLLLQHVIWVLWHRQECVNRKINLLDCRLMHHILMPVF